MFEGCFFGEVLLLDAFAGAAEGLEDAAAIEGLEQVVDRVHVEGAHGVLVECSGEDDLRHGAGRFFVEELFDDGEAIEAGHLDVEEDEVGMMGLDEVDGFKAVAALGEDLAFVRRGDTLSSSRASCSLSMMRAVMGIFRPK